MLILELDGLTMKENFIFKYYNIFSLSLFYNYLVLLILG